MFDILFTAETFRRFPTQTLDPQAPLSPQAAADLHNHGHDVALFNEWHRALIAPTIRAIKAHNAAAHTATAPSATRTRHVLRFGGEFRTFHALARAELALPRALRAALARTAADLAAALGAYWAAYYRAAEACAPQVVERSPFGYGALDDGSRARAHVWFERAGLDSRRLSRGVVAAVEGGRTGGGWADERCVAGRRVWGVFLAGLARFLANDDTQMVPSRALRQIPEWRERFFAFQTSMDDGAAAALDTMGDPVTVGGAFGAMSRMAVFRTGDAAAKEALLTECVVALVRHVWAGLRMSDAAAEQAVCAFVGMHREWAEGAGAA
ncbi:hypothetical protein HDZ31DRAFT_72597 [Schizophyllum fasciatum]